LECVCAPKISLNYREEEIHQKIIIGRAIPRHPVYQRMKRS